MLTGRIKYKSVLFKSKEEATFAKSLELAGLNWVYHPYYCGHRWTFLAFSSTDKERSTLIDYHATQPTMNYADRLTAITSEYPSESIIVYGGPWERNFEPSWDSGRYKVYPVYTFHGEYGWGCFDSIADNGTGEVVSTYSLEDILGIGEEETRVAKEYFDRR